MVIIKLDYKNPDKLLLAQATELASEDKVFIYPTDTVYGIGCKLEEDAVERVYEIKRRERENPLSLAVGDINMVRHYAFVDGRQEETIKKTCSEGTTYILEKKDTIPDYVTAGRNTVGVRVLTDPIIKEITKAAGPIITTSANTTGTNPTASFDKIEMSLIKAADFCINSGTCTYKRPSKIIDLTQDGEVIRE